MGQGWEWLAKDAQTRQGLWSDSFTAPESLAQRAFDAWRSSPSVVK